MTTIPAYRLTEIESRQHRFQVLTPAQRKARRKRFIDAALACAVVAAVAVCGWYSISPPQPGAARESHPAPGTITADTAPVVWRRDPNSSAMGGRVARKVNKTRRGASDNSPAPGFASKRKGGM